MQGVGKKLTPITRECETCGADVEDFSGRAGRPRKKCANCVASTRRALERRRDRRLRGHHTEDCKACGTTFDFCRVIPGAKPVTCSEQCAARHARDSQKKNSRKKLVAGYGISEEQYNEMLIRQEHACAICGGNRSKNKLGIDHDHETGRVRELLCGPCNSGIGMLADSPELLRKGMEYLLKHMNGQNPDAL